MQTYLLNLLVYAAVFFSIVIISYYFFPLVFARIKQSQDAKLNKASQELEKLFISVSLHRLRLLFLVIILIAAGLGFVLFKIIGLVIGIAIAFLFPLLAIKFVKGARKRRFGQQLIDAIMVLNSSLKAGLSFTQAIDMVSQEMPAPICEEFFLAYKQIKMGVSLEETLRNLDRRMDMEELKFVTSAILVAQKVGGDFPSVLTKLVSTLRDRIKLKENITTYTLQGKAQGYIISFIPLVFLFIVLRQNPHHFDIMLSTDLGRVLLAAAVLLNTIGIFFILKMSKIKV